MRMRHEEESQMCTWLLALGSLARECLSRTAHVWLRVAARGYVCGSACKSKAEKLFGCERTFFAPNKSGGLAE